VGSTAHAIMSNGGGQPRQIITEPLTCGNVLGRKVLLTDLLLHLPVLLLGLYCSHSKDDKQGFGLFSRSIKLV